MTHSRAAILSLTALLWCAEARAALAPTPSVFVAVQPCRIADTRSAAAGILAGGTTRTFNVVGATTNYSAQGGVAGGCGIPGFVAGVAQVQAVAINVVAVSPTAEGFLKAWPTDQPAPLASTVNFQMLTPNLNIANGVIVPVRQDVQGGDISIAAGVASTHVIVDITGYFVRGPLAPIASLQARGIAAGGDHSCALRGNGTASCWGLDNSGQSTVPGSLFKQIAAGAYHSCGVKTDGSVACWGTNGFGQVSPVTAGTYTRVAAGAYHSCGVKTDGSVACWGRNGESLVSPVTAGTYTQVAAGGTHSCGVNTLSGVACWGSNNLGQVSPIPGGIYTQVAAGGLHSCGLKTDGSVICWGSNGSGRVSPVAAGTYTQVAAGGSHSCGVKTDGSVACWGDNTSGQVLPVPAGTYTQVSAGGDHSCGLKTDGSVACWGDNTFGESAPPSAFP